jgi:inhibitor of cysteine peptidase
MAIVTEKSTRPGAGDPVRVLAGAVVAFMIVGAAVVIVLLANAGQGAREPATVNVSEQNANSNVQLHVGDRLVVTLDGNPTTGYTWEVDSSDAAILKPVGEAQFTPGTSAVGSVGEVTLQFDAVGAGQTPLKLIYHRPFETGVAPLKTFELTITVAK